MARRSPPLAPNVPALTVDQKRRCVLRLQSCIDELESFDPNTVQKRYETPEVLAIEAGIEDALAAAFGHGTPTFSRYQPAAQLDNGPNVIRPAGIWAGAQSLVDAQETEKARRYLAEGKRQSVALLRQAIRTLQHEIEDQEQTDARSDADVEPSDRDLSKVFVVHGRDDGARETVARFLTQLGVTPIILHELANQGRTVIEKVEANSKVGFAVILLTPDDEGCLKGETPKPRARQNVLLELGYFIGRLGRKNVCALKRGELEIPSDFAGVIAEDFDEAGGWKLKLARELHAAGYKFDLTKLMLA